MKLWLIERDVGGYDECEGFVIRAESEENARKIAAQNHADESEAEWIDPTRSTCKHIAVDGDEEVILTDFHAG